MPHSVFGCQTGHEAAKHVYSHPTRAALSQHSQSHPSKGITQGCQNAFRACLDKNSPHFLRQPKTTSQDGMSVPLLLFCWTRNLFFVVDWHLRNGRS